ncbi:pyridoxal-phosphate dependent enzyme [Haloarculaceae archaeon H-GB2-1]|nr:pyridoxal-phosphate dependent enzyme [Haloarculaceae archaeon H-GB1-1]MEA5407980.1 pyridoxal-phosphate dependent enzyme [Haloarculaceae archaeon H-GB2-1]
MEPSSPLTGVSCTDCGRETTTEEWTARCPDCGGIYAVSYDRDELQASFGRFDGLARFAPVLPIAASALITMDEGTTPLVECPSLAEDFDVGSVYVKDEGANPTGSLADRGVGLAVSAAARQGAEAIALPSTGPDGQAAAAYGARAGLDVEVFVPSRSTFDAKAMINVHGGEMSVVGGRYGDAVDAFDAERDDALSLAPFATPYRVEGTKTLAYEICEQLDWDAPDAVVHPTGHGESLVGIETGFSELSAAGHTATVPQLVAAQPTGCSPFVDALEGSEDAPVPCEQPDTICGPLEVPTPDPAGGGLALDALAATEGTAAATSDDDALELAVRTAQEDGVELSATGGVAASVARDLAHDGTYGPDDTVVVVNPIAGEKEADVLRSHLMRQGI